MIDHQVDSYLKPSVPSGLKVNPENESWADGSSSVDIVPVKPRMSRFLLDPGWPYVLAGILTLLAAGLIPSQIELEERELNVAALRMERDEFKRLHDAYGVFLDEIGTRNASLARRLAGAQLWLIPEGHQPLTIVKTHSESPSRWIERSASALDPSRIETKPPLTRSMMRHSMLASLLEGSGRLWLFAAALISIFAGLLLGTTSRQDAPVEEFTSS